MPLNYKDCKYCGALVNNNDVCCYCQSKLKPHCVYYNNLPGEIVPVPFCDLKQKLIALKDSSGRNLCDDCKSKKEVKLR